MRCCRLGLGLRLRFVTLYIVQGDNLLAGATACALWIVRPARFPPESTVE